MQDLNALRINCADGPDEYQTDYGCVSGTVEVVFRKVEWRLCQEIGRHTALVGCVAWLTSELILRAMARMRSVNLIVQKEDFLRPDAGMSNARLRVLYSRLDSPFGPPYFGYNTHGDPSGEPIRCAGNYNREKSPSHPRMHNKFLVFFDTFGACDEVPEHGGVRLGAPCAVWTGSYNFTRTGGASWENAVIIRDRKIARAYYDQFVQIYGLSEPLDWESDWVAPDVRIGS